MAVAQRKPSRHGASRKAMRPAREQSIEIDWRPALRWIWGFAILVLSVQLVTWAVAQLDQPISEVKVSGALRYIDQRALERLINGKVRDGVLTTELRDIQREVQDHPWIEKVAIRRQWPGVLSVWLQERVPVARWGEHSLLTAEGEIFTPEHDISWMSLPHLRGADGQVAQVMKQFELVQESMGELSIEVLGIEQVPRGAWQVELASGRGVTLLLGQYEVAQKLERFKKIYVRELQRQVDAIERIDLRYSNGLAVHWRATAEQKEQV